MKEAIANSLHLITQFCEPHLNERPVDILGQECWDMMLSVATVFEAELASCQENLRSVEWPFQEVLDAMDTMVCPECKSRLIKVVEPTARRDAITFMCQSCQSESLYIDVAGPAVETSMAAENHWRARHGDEPATCSCPECNHDTLLVHENECAACFYEFEHTHCEWCEEALSVEERQYSEGTCSYCQNRYDRIMAE